MGSGLVNGGDYFYNNLSFTVTRYNGIMATDSTQCVKKSRGRPKVFDRDAALDKAMKLFWQHGYEATSLADLVEATGAKAPTLYAEFTNKEGLFRAVLDRYIDRFAAKHEAQLFCEEKSVESALADYFAAIANCFTSKDTPAGCFMINNCTTLSQKRSHHCRDTCCDNCGGSRCSPHTRRICFKRQRRYCRTQC